MRRYILLVAARAFICAFAYPSDTTQAGRQAGQTSKRESALYSVWFDSNLFEATAQHLCFGNMLVIVWQHVEYLLAAYSVLPCPGIMLCVDLTEQHSQCCHGLATYSVLLRSISLATFVAQPLHLENFYDPALRRTLVVKCPTSMYL